MSHEAKRARRTRTLRAGLWTAAAASLLLPGLLFMDRSTGANPPGLPATEQIRVLPAGPVDVEPFNIRNQLVVHPTNSQVMYWAITGLGVLKSVDRGAHWVPKNFGLPSLATRAITMDPANPNHLLVGFDGHTVAQGPWPYRTVDGGERWEPTVLCERQGMKENLRQEASCELVSFDQSASNWFYYLVHSQASACGGFYRSCDQGASYDRNPRCITLAEAQSPQQLFQRPACASGLPEPVNSYNGNDASILVVNPSDGALYVNNGVHVEEVALMTSNNKGGLFTYQDVVDSGGKTFVPGPEQGVLSLYASAFALRQSDPAARYAAVAPIVRICSDDKAHPTTGCAPRPPTGSTPPRLIVRWFGLTSNSGTGADCTVQNDCDGDNGADRVWEPIFNAANRPSSLNVDSIVVLPTATGTPDRILVSGNGSPGEVLMLTRGAPTQEWSPALVYDGTGKILDRLVVDPADPTTYYLLARTGIIPSLHRLTSDATFSTWSVQDVVTTTDFFHVYDLVETNGSSGHRITAATSNGLRVADELGTSWSAPDIYHTHDAGPVVAPSDPNRTYSKRAFAVTIGTNGFQSMSEMDDVTQRRDVMCTNVFNDLTVHPANSAILYAATGSGIWRNLNAHPPIDAADKQAIGLAWQSFARASDGLADEYVWSLAFDPFRTDHSWMLAGTRSGLIYESLNFGDTWSPASMNVSPSLQALLKDVRDIQYLPTTKGFAATAAGVLERRRHNQAWIASMSGDRIARLAIGASGTECVYAAGDLGIYRTLNAGSAWEALPLVPKPPYSAVLETKSLDGRHHLWVPDFRNGLYRISTTMRAHPGSGTTSVLLDWTHSAGEPTPAGYELHYGTNPDQYDGSGASQGHSPILLGSVTSATLSGLNFQTGGPYYVALKAIDGMGQRGPIGLPLKIQFGYVFSPVITVTQAPGCVTALRLTWPAVAGASGYKIYRRVNTAGTSFALLTTLPGTQTTFDDATAVHGTSYLYYATTTYGATETSGGASVSGTPTGDFDMDGIQNTCDNCPSDYNPNQNFVGAPYVEVISPNGGELLPEGSQVTLQWYAEDSCGGVSSVDLSISRNNGAPGSWQSIATGISNSGARAWTVTSPGSILALFKVEAHDPANNTGADTSDATFTIKACSLCQYEYCTGVEIGCRATGVCGVTGCCYYQCGIPMPNCIYSECPPNVCGGCGGQ